MNGTSLRSIMLQSYILILCFILRTEALERNQWDKLLIRMAAEHSSLKGSYSNFFWDDVAYETPFSMFSLVKSSPFIKNYWYTKTHCSQKASSTPYTHGRLFNFRGSSSVGFQYNAFTVKTSLDIDQLYQSPATDFVWKKDRFASGRLDEAFMQYTWQNGFIRLGRLNRNWGPFPDRSLILSDNPFSYDGIEWQLITSLFEFRHLISAFPSVYSNYDTFGPLVNRYLSTHSLNFFIAPWLQLGVSESLVFSRQTGIPDFAYINPFSIYFVESTNGGGSTNLMLAFQGWCIPYFKNTTFKFQILVDDFQVDNAGPIDQEPTHWGYDMGLYIKNFIPSFLMHHHLVLEYRYLSKWLYTVTDGCTAAGERYTYLGRSLGQQDIDGDYTKIGFFFKNDESWATQCAVSVMRQDTNTIKTMWNSECGLGYRKETALSKRKYLKTTICPSIEILYLWRTWCSFGAGLENNFISDKKISHHFVYKPVFTATLTVHLWKRFRLKQQ